MNTFVKFSLFAVVSLLLGCTDSLSHMDQETKAQFQQQMQEVKGLSMEMDDSMPSGSVLMQGVFKEKAHAVEGMAKILEEGGERTLRFENFKTINGPRLHIWLSADLKGEDYVDLGKIKATKGNVNYNVDSSVDLEKYNKVLVWCVPFRVLFSYAELS